LVFGLIVLSPFLQAVFVAANDAVGTLLSFSNAGATFAFRSIEPHFIDVPGADGGHTSVFMAGQVSPPMKTFAFWILPTIIFFSTLMSILYHLGVMTVIVSVIARVMVWTLGTSGAETLSTAGNIFLGQTEAPLLIRPFLPKMTRSELMAVMTGGFATVAGGVMGAYVGFLQGAIPDIAGHLMVASILSAPAAFAMAKLVVPETEVPETRGNVNISFPKTASNVVEAGANGASDGMKLAINVAAMLIAAVALMAMLDWMVGWTPLTRCGDAWSVGYACGDGVAARGFAQRGVELAATAAPGLRRHQVKSDVVLAAALCSAGDLPGSRRVADAALADSEAAGLVPLRWAVACLLAGIGSAQHSPGEVAQIRDRSAIFVARHGGCLRGG
jgi:nucleoside permease NupC